MSTHSVWSSDQSSGLSRGRLHQARDGLYRSTLLVATIASFFMGSSATGTAGIFTANFNSDPSSILNFGGSLWDGSTTARTGSANWRNTDGAGPVGSTAKGPATGVNGDGFLQLTFASPDCSSTLSSYLCGGILFDDFDKGATVAGFTFECDLRIGNGTQSPADGFSINYVRNTDPVLKALLAGDSFPQMNVAISANGGAFSDDGNNPSLMEEGCQTGLSVGFDMWDSGNHAIPPKSGCVGVEAPGIIHDCIGLDIRVDNVLLTTIPMPNGTAQNTYDPRTGTALAKSDPNGNNAATDPTAIETGPYDGTGCDSTLKWVHLKVDMATNGLLNVWYKNTQILTNMKTSYFPSPGRLLMASRVGGATANIEIDNVQITTIAAAAPLLAVGSATLTLTGGAISVFDAPPSIADTNTIVLKLNGTAISPNSVTKASGQTTITFDTGKYFPSGSTNTVSLTIKDTQSPAQTVSVDRTVEAPTYATLPESLALTSAQVDTSKPGFIWLMSQVASTGSDAQNSTQRTLDQLAGLLGPNIADPNAIGVATGPGTAGATANDPIRFEIPTLLELDRNGASWGSWGAQASGDQMPGSPGTAGGTDNQAAAAVAYVNLPAGLITMGVNSDDGFLTVAGSYNDVLSQVRLPSGEYNGGRGVADSLFSFLVTKPGIYPMVTYWENGGGDSRVVWFTVKADGTQVALNDTANGGFATYRALVAGSQKAGVSFATPAPNATGVLPNTSLSVKIADGSTPIDKSTVSLKLDGAAVAATVAKSGSVTTVAYTPASLFASGSTHTATLAYTEGGTTVSHDWQFTVMTYRATTDTVKGYVGLVIGPGGWTPDKGGHTGQTGDYAIDSTAGGGTWVDILNYSFLNAAAPKDQLSMALWVKKYDIAAGSAFWARVSQVASGTDLRGYQAHIPWSDDNIYFDTAGCCDTSLQRISANINTFSGYTGSDNWWTNWHHFAFTKNGATKNIYIDGKLFLTGSSSESLQPSFNGLALLTDGLPGGDYIHGLIDDYAVFSTELSATDAANLASGTSPTKVNGLVAYWPFNDPAATPTVGPKLTAVLSQGKITVTWSAGSLQTAPAITGPWTDSSATSPLSETASDGAKFYRAKQ